MAMGKYRIQSLLYTARGYIGTATFFFFLFFSHRSVGRPRRESKRVWFIAGTKPFCGYPYSGQSSAPGCTLSCPGRPNPGKAREHQRRHRPEVLTATYLLLTGLKTSPFSAYQFRSLLDFQAPEIPSLPSLLTEIDICSAPALDLPMVLQQWYNFPKSSQIRTRQIGLVNHCWGMRFNPLTISRFDRDFPLVREVVVVLSYVSQN